MNGNKTIRNFRHGLYYGFIVCPSFCLQHKTVLNIQPSFVIIIKTRLHQCLYQYNLKVLSLSDRISYLIQQFSWLPQKMEQINLSFFSPFFFGIIRIQFDSVHAERPFIWHATSPGRHSYSRSYLASLNNVLVFLTVLQVFQVLLSIYSAQFLMRYLI